MDLQRGMVWINLSITNNMMTPVAAIKGEKRLKKYLRKWKLNLIEKSNPNWKDLYTELATGCPD